jgi:hypothetical protein
MNEHLYHKAANLKAKLAIPKQLTNYQLQKYSQ